MLIWKNNRILFSDDNLINAVMVSEACVSYTLKTEDVTKQPRVECTPYVSHKEEFDKNGFAKETKTQITVTSKDGGLEFFVETRSEELSEFGIYLPFNFISKKNGGGWKKQFLFNSPYQSKDNEYIYCYFSNPSGRNIIVIMQSPVDGWKMDYSPYVGGHFFDNFKILANFDRAYKTNTAHKNLRFSVFEVGSFEEGLQRVSKTLGLPVAYYDKNAGAVGEEMCVRIIGDCDYVYINDEKKLVNGKEVPFVLRKTGDTYIVPEYQGKKGLDATMYAFTSLSELYKIAMDSVSDSDLRQTDGNLCEHQCWAAAMLRYMQKYGANANYEARLKSFLDKVTETDEEKAKHYSRITIFDKKQENGLPPYHIYGSRRIQEQFFGITILLDSYKYFGDEKYLRYAMGALNTLIDCYQSEAGGFITAHGGKLNDYSTVCCPMIPIVDMTNFLKDKDAALSNKYRKSAEKLASYLYNRGECFPTETEETDEVEEEREEGSISCTALALLYYSANMKYNAQYVEMAIRLLDIHEAWVVKTPIAQMYRSSLRWWETRWEGDKDGPALCMAHAWSIWRAEADYWAYIATNDKKWLRKAQCGFYGNFAKINEKGESYAIYQADYIAGGGFLPGVEKRFEILPKFPRQTDSGLSRYVWIRAADTILK